MQHFKAFDHDNDGLISMEEFIVTLKSNRILDSLNICDDMAKSIFDSLDLNGNGCIDYSEFVALISQKVLMTDKDILRSIFMEID